MGVNISSNRNIYCGIQQGSILGPKLFILYINYICNISEILRLTLFADDTNILYSSIEIYILHKQIISEQSNRHVWFNINKLSLNKVKLIT